MAIVNNRDLKILIKLLLTSLVMLLLFKKLWKIPKVCDICQFCSCNIALKTISTVG